MTFSEKLLNLRKDHGLSQEKLAEQLNVSRQAISRREMSSALPDAQNLLQLSRLFSVSIDYLLHDDFESDHDIPAVRQTEENLRFEAEKDRNRQMAVTVVLGLQALCFFWALTGYVVFHAWLMVFPLVTCQFIGLLAFEAAFHKQGLPNRGAQIYRLKYYRAVIWLVSYFPIRMVSYTPLRHLIYGLANSFYFLPLWVTEALVLTLYLLLCGLVTQKLTRTIKEIQA